MAVQLIKKTIFTERFNRSHDRSRICLARLPIDLAFTPKCRDTALTILKQLVDPQWVAKVINRPKFLFRWANIFYLNPDALPLRLPGYGGWYIILSAESAALSVANWDMFFNKSNIVEIAPRSKVTFGNAFEHYASRLLSSKVDSFFIKNVSNYMKTWLRVNRDDLRVSAKLRTDEFLSKTVDRGFKYYGIPSVQSSRQAGSQKFHQPKKVTRQAAARRRRSEADDDDSDARDDAHDASDTRDDAHDNSHDDAHDDSRDDSRDDDDARDDSHDDDDARDDSRDDDDARDDSHDDDECTGAAHNASRKRRRPSSSDFPMEPMISSGSDRVRIAVRQKLSELADAVTKTYPLHSSLLGPAMITSQQRQDDCDDDSRQRVLLPALNLPQTEACHTPDMGLPFFSQDFSDPFGDAGQTPATPFPALFCEVQQHSSRLEDLCVSYLAGFGDQYSLQDLSSSITKRLEELDCGGGYGSALAKLPQLQYIAGAVNLLEGLVPVLSRKYCLGLEKPSSIFDKDTFVKLKGSGCPDTFCSELETIVDSMQGVFAFKWPILFQNHFLSIAVLNILYDSVYGGGQGRPGASRASDFQDIAHLTATNLASAAACIDRLLTISEGMIVSTDPQDGPGARLDAIISVVKPLRRIPDIFAPVSRIPYTVEDVVRRLSFQGRELAQHFQLRQLSEHVENYIRDTMHIGKYMPGPIFESPSIMRFLPHTQFSHLSPEHHDDNSFAGFASAMTPLSS